MSPQRRSQDPTAAHVGAPLPCGRSSDDVLEQVAQGRGDERDAHQAGCVHCRAALSEASRLWAPVARLAARREVPPPDLLGQVMASIRELARERRHLVLVGERGSTRVAAEVLARIAQQAAAGVAGVRVAFGQTRGADAVGVTGRHVVVELAVVTGYGHSIPAVADGVRAAVAERLVALAGASTVDVNIYVDDVLPPAAGA